MLIKVSLILFLFFSFSLHSQENKAFGELNEFEENFNSYEKDSDASAVVLFEKGNIYFEIIDGRIYLAKEYHSKIKILERKGFEHGNITIPLHYGNGVSEKTGDIQAITHTKGIKTLLKQEDIFETNIEPGILHIKFTFPKIEVGSILEYQYTLLSPFLFKLTGWNFQDFIPKLYSEFNAEIPAYYFYNRTLLGKLKLAKNDSRLKKKCFRFNKNSRKADCEVVKYSMIDIPAFKMDEGYMLAPSNYISRIEFELSEHTKFSGFTDNYTLSWEDVDKQFKGNKDIGRQLTKTGFFENHVPEKLLKDGDELIRAKNIFAFVQKHFTWNKKYGIYGKARVKEAFDRRTGNVSEINMSLINLLNAANIKTNLMLISTRQEGLPKKTHPVMSDFNYSIAKVRIAGKDYLLDATDKYVPFGMLPFRALNHYGRVMDFKNDSFWFDISPETNNKYQVRASVKFNVPEKKAIGVLDVTNFGYQAVNTQKKLDDFNEEDYLHEVEKNIDRGVEITAHKVMTERNTKAQVSERFEFEIDNILGEEMVYFNPFLVTFFKKNPFLLEKRTYPVDFGYQRSYKYQISIEVPDGYIIHVLPKDQAMQLGDRMVFLSFLHKESSKQLTISFDLAINRTTILSEDYEGLKSIFKQVTNIQNNSLVVLKKI